MPLLRATKALERPEASSNDDQRTAIEIVRRAIQWPARYIVDNAGVDASIVVGKLIEHKDYAYGYDAQTGEYGDMFKLGIIDPTKVVRTALQDAASVAGLLITTEAMVAEKPKKEAPAPAMPRRRNGLLTRRTRAPATAPFCFDSRGGTGPRVTGAPVR